MCFKCVLTSSAGFSHSFSPRELNDFQLCQINVEQEQTQTFQSAQDHRATGARPRPTRADVRVSSVEGGGGQWT